MTTNKKPKFDPNNISPENRLEYTPEELKYMAENQTTPVIEMQEGKCMPIFITGVPLTALGHDIHFMAAIQYYADTKEIEVRGRIRFEATGNKAVFPNSIKEQYSQKNLDKMKNNIRAAIMDMATNKQSPLKMIKAPFELNFNIDESVESIMKKMNDSNQFNIGVIDQKETAKYKN